MTSKDLESEEFVLKVLIVFYRNCATRLEKSLKEITKKQDDAVYDPNK